MEPNYTILSAGQYINSNTSLSGTVIIRGEEDFVLVNGATLSFSPGTTVVFSGDRMMLSTVNGGKIIADGVEFLEAGTNSAGVYVNAPSSSFTDCTFTGLSYGLRVNSHHTLIDGCSFSGNQHGLYVNAGYYVPVYNSTFSGNTYGIYALGQALVDGMGSTYSTGNTFLNNTHGLYSFGNGYIFAENTNFSGNTTAASALVSGVLGFGGYELGNRFGSNTQHISNQTSITVQAKAQYYVGADPTTDLVYVKLLPTIALDPTNPWNTSSLCELDLATRRNNEAICDGGGPGNPGDIAKSRATQSSTGDEQLSEQLHQLYASRDAAQLRSRVLELFARFVVHRQPEVFIYRAAFEGFLLQVAQADPTELTPELAAALTPDDREFARQFRMKSLLLGSDLEGALTQLQAAMQQASEVRDRLSYLGMKLDVMMRMERYQDALGLLEFIAQLLDYLPAQKVGTTPSTPIICDQDLAVAKAHIEQEMRLNQDKSIGIDEMLVESEPLQPEGFILHPAYPNPFNPTTTVRIQLEQASVVNLAVYNLIGQRVALLANGVLQSGFHSFTFDAAQLPTGTYVIQAHLGAHIQTQKITLIK